MKFKSIFNEIADVVMGQSPSGEDVTNSICGLPLLNGPSEFTSFHPIPVQYTEKGKKFANPNDILFCVRGSTTGKMNIADQKYAIGRGLAAIKGKNGYSTKYVQLILEQNLDRLLTMATGSTFPNVSRDLLLNFEVDILPVTQANETSNIFNKIDQKIQLNTQINQTLEQIAQALFKSWFVDFDPVRAKVQALSDGLSLEQAELAAMQAISGKTPEELTALSQAEPDRYAELAETAKAFPCEMVEVDGVEMPKGWEYCSFGDVSECFDSKRIPLSKQQREKRKGNIPYYGATSVMDYVDEAIFDDIYLLVGEDGSVLKEDGTPFTQYIWGKSWVNNHAHILKGRNGISTEHLMIFIQQTNISAYITGAVQLKLNQKNMNSIPFLKANNKINVFFAEYIESLYEKIRKNLDENKILETARDLLLPRLLNGEIQL